jgi:hypothetical protein
MIFSKKQNERLSRFSPLADLLRNKYEYLSRLVFTKDGYPQRAQK